MKILITGASGLLGTAISQALSREGHQVIPLRRQVSNTFPCWDPAKKQIDLGETGHIDGVIHLAGENIANGRWTPEKKRRILESRVEGTRLISETISRISPRPRFMISGSAVGFYGDRGDQEVTEEAGKGRGFLAEVCSQWEQATERAFQAGIRVVTMRTGMVLSPDGGALAKMLPPFRIGLGGVMGSGKQYISWVGIHELAAIINHIIATDTLSGPVNVVSPHPVTNQEFTMTLAKQLGRPAILPLPAWLAKIIFGEMAQALLLTGTRAIPQKLLRSGYTFKDPYLDGALTKLFPG